MLWPLVVVMGFGAGWLGLGAMETRAVYPFDATRVAPQAVGVDAREVIRTDGGQRQVIWVARPQPGKPVILYFHGNAGNLANRAERFRQFTRRGYGLIAPAYRGSSGSTGTPGERALSADMRALYGDLGGMIPGLTPGQVIFYGESLGTGVALKLVAQSGVQPAGVVLEAPYTSLPDVVRDSVPQMAPLAPLMRNVWNSATHARALRAPLLVLHGTRDDVIPLAQGRAVTEAAGSRERTFVPVEGAGHHDVWQPATLGKLWAFIDAQALSMR